MYWTLAEAIRGLDDVFENFDITDKWLLAPHPLLSWSRPSDLPEAMLAGFIVGALHGEAV